MAKKIINTAEKKKAKEASTRTMWVTISVIVIAIGAAIAAIIFLQTRNTSQTNDQQKEVTAGSTVKEALETGKTPEEKTLKEALAKNPSVEEKQQLFQLLADDAQRRGDYQATVNYLKQAHEAGVTVALLVQSIASLYLEKLNDKPNALKYFKEARQLTEQQKNDDPYSEKNLQYIDSKIKELEAQGVTPAQ